LGDGRADLGALLRGAGWQLIPIRLSPDGLLVEEVAG
jgi:hypothetical protein